MLTPYQFASNTPIQAIDLDGLEAIFGSQKDAEIVVRDLNVIYSKTYPKVNIDNFFSVEKSVRKVSDKSQRINEWRVKDPTTWTNVFKDPVYATKEVTKFIISPNPEFNWDTDQYTQAFYDVLSGPIPFPVEIVPENSHISRYAGKIGVDPSGKKGGARGYSIEDGSRLTWLSSNLNTVDPEGPLKRVWTFGGTALHELVIHHHPIGDIEGSGGLDEKYNLPTGRMGAHNGAVLKKTQGWNQEILRSLHKKRINTGALGEIEGKIDEKANDKRASPKWLDD
ncbi:hypothetical protein [Lunatibacter salilacus]|uniref:hypothetical protein n=1 Tax=Lunatibacter salilacus TaxID=2483804 RepID=UPI001F453A18|nr:hypothetical protein [Lunatibacter salilacus]